MKTKPPLHTIALVGLLISILVGQAGAQGFFWCHGEERSVLEYAEGQDCNQGPRQRALENHDGDTFALSLRAEDCGPCIDVAATDDVTFRRSHDRSNLQGKTGLPALALGSLLSEIPRTLAAKRSPQQSPGISQTILFQRTIVLLI